MASRSHTETESRYSSIECECLGVRFGLKKFAYYLLGRNKVVGTCHSSLEEIFKRSIAVDPARLQNCYSELLSLT